MASAGRSSLSPISRSLRTCLTSSSPSSLRSISSIPSSSRLSLPSKPSLSSPSLLKLGKEAQRFNLTSSTTSIRNASSDSKPTQMTVRDALNSAMEEEMLRDDNVFILGEEVARCE